MTLPHEETYPCLECDCSACSGDHPHAASHKRKAEAYDAMLTALEMHAQNANAFELTGACAVARTGNHRTLQANLLTLLGRVTRDSRDYDGLRADLVDLLDSARDGGISIPNGDIEHLLRTWTR